MSTVQFWLKEGKNYWRLPVNPPEFQVSSPFGVNRVQIAGLGEVTIPGERNLKDISFDCFFPRDYNGAYCEYSGFKKPSTWVNQIEKWRDARKPVQFVVTGTSINMKVLIESFDIKPERAGHVGDIYYSISLVQYKAPTVKKLVKNKNKAKVTTSRPKSTTTKSKMYVVKKGDCLWNIAKKYYGKGSQWKKIYNANKKVIGKNPNLIYPGQKLVIP